MLQVNHQPLSQPNSKAIQEWLGNPAARDFIRYLEFQDAELTADAGNLLCGDTDVAHKEAKLKAAEANNIRSLIDLLQSMRATDYQFRTNTIEPKTSSTSEPTP